MRTAVTRRRFDEDGLDDVDTEASSHPLWKEYVRKLNFRMKAQLDIWRGGAVWTPTRRYSCPNGQNGSDTQPSQLAELHPPPASARNKEARDLARKCGYCGYHSASSLHLVARCPAFAQVRNEAIKSTGLYIPGDLFLHLILVIQQDFVEEASK